MDEGEWAKTLPFSMQRNKVRFNFILKQGDVMSSQGLAFVIKSLWSLATLS